MNTLKKTVDWNRFHFCNKFHEKWQIVYDGYAPWINKTFNEKIAWDWYFGNKDFDTVEIKRYNNVQKIRIPVSHAEPWWYDDITQDVQRFIGISAQQKQIDDVLVSNWIEIFKLYDVIDEDGQIRFKKKKEDVTWDVDKWLWLMKQFIYWLFRVSPLKDKQWKDIIVSQDFENIQYNYKWNQYTTPVYGVYAPHHINSIFSPMSSDGKSGKLAPRQSKSMYYFWKKNFIMASRGIGKSLLLSVLSELLLMVERTDPWAIVKPTLINWFSQSEQQNEQTINYIISTIELSGDKYWKYSKTNGRLEVIDYVDKKEKTIATLQFYWEGSKSKWVGSRPYAIVIDEASKVDEEIYRQAMGQYVSDGALIFCISTIEHDTEINWFYQEAVRAEMEMLSYEPMDDLVVRLWRKYWMDKMKKEDLFAFETRAKLWEMKKELLYARETCCMRWDIHNAVHLSEQDIERNIAQFAHLWDDFINAQFYCILNRKATTFNMQWLSVETLPNTFETMVVGYDKWWESDKAAATLIGVQEWKMYVLESMELPTDVTAQCDVVNDIKNRWVDRCATKYINCVVDVTCWPWEAISWMEIRNFLYDAAIMTTWWSRDPHFDKWRLYVNQKELVRNWQEAINIWHVRFSWEVDALLEQIENFWTWKTQWWKKRYWAKKWRDDMVMSMLIALFYAYSDVCLAYKSNFYRRSLQRNEPTVLTLDMMIGIAEADRNKQLDRSDFNYRAWKY